GYRWFALMNFYWWLGSQEYLGYKSITETQNQYENALKNARQMGDFYMMQKFLLSLLLKSHTVKQEKKTYAYLKELLEISTLPNLSLRQKFRGFDKIIQILATGSHIGLSRAVMRESVALAKAQTDPAFAIGAEINAGIFNTQTQNFEDAEKWFLKARQDAESLPEETDRTANLTKIFLNLGNLEGRRNNYNQAAVYYDEALELSKKNGKSPLLYEIKKSRLFNFQAAGKEDQTEPEIPSVIELAENYRKQITTEDDRNTFFDNEQSVYDLAIEHEMRGNNFERAYNYTEASSSRSLLDWLVKGTEDDFKNPAAPLDINQIREAMPPEVQILQFRVLDKKVLIWLISKEKAVSFSSEIDANELKTKTEKYLKLIETNDPQNEDAVTTLSREFYNLLIAPARLFLDESKQICIVPNKILFRLPFQSLTAPDGKFFLEEFTFFYSPSASVFISDTQNASVKAEIKEEKLLSIDNPVFDRERFPKLDVLRETEAQEIRRNYPKSEVLSERAATKNAFLTLYKNFEVIHFAGHYIVEADSPLLSKLVMAKSGEKAEDSVLTNRELRGERLPQTKLVVLSACQTGIEGYYNSEGLIGLARTFLAAGVPLVVASAWEVESEATSALMKKFHYYRRGKSLSTTQALRQAQLDMIRTPDKRFQSAYFWAAFAVFGGYADY
ncbi:MAG TPA: CHAT domain-containing tetratricopeptide repeat protein, partial [Pyrinomonadaceae bacterium]|nr:CHAT domain-containing tetratricopeptide repeat protein [Pyrinomonadaceae bacterium]